MAFADQKRNIILTGFMGTGKTTVGELLARHLGYQFIDTDVLIEARSGRTVAAIFSEMGEATFRELERELAQELSTQKGLVISTGGRMMLDPENVKALGQNGRIFCLVATPAEILARVTDDPKRIERPLLKVPNPRKRIVELLQERQEKYQRFLQVPTSGLHPNEVMEAILDRMSEIF